MTRISSYVNKKLHGPFVIVTKKGHVFGASTVEAAEDDLIVRLVLPLKTMEHRIKPEDIEVAYEVDPTHPAVRINAGILSAVTSLERMLMEFTHGKPPYILTIFGSGSLSLTLLPDRSTNDLDVLSSDAFAAFVNEKNEETDIEIELLDEALLNLLGPWETRTNELRGPLGYQFRLVHPLDTVMQKLLRYTQAHFEEKDRGDIDEVVTSLQPSKDTLINLLTENPTRYARLPGRFSSQADAVERNTRWFLNAYLPEISFEQIIEQAGDRAMEAPTLAGFLPKIPIVDFRTILKKRTNLEP